MAEWVTGIEERICSLDASLEAIVKSNREIASIAKQVNILAINATIEAARAGDSGKGFAVVADAINELSRKTALAAESIGDNITDLGSWTTSMRDDAQRVAKKTASLLQTADQTAEALDEIASGTRATYDDARQIATRAKDVEKASAEFAPSFQKIENAAQTLSAGVTHARARLGVVADHCEGMVQATANISESGPDAPFIAIATQTAEQVSGLFAKALTEGAIGFEDLFSKDLHPLPGTNPQQYMARYTELTDRLLPAVLEEVLTFDTRIIFTAAVNVQGYLPTHNRKFMHPQSSDPEWNAAHCRNRRLFNDRVGLRAGQNTDPFLVQVYRRDMGNGNFALIKDISVPIVVNGRHWGGLRLGYAT